MHLLCLLILIAFASGLVVPFYMKTDMTFVTGSLLCGEQSVFEFVLEFFRKAFADKTGVRDVIVAMAADKYVWLVVGLGIALFFTTVLTFFSEKHSRGWFYISCLVATVAGLSYQGVVDFSALPGIDLILVACAFAAFCLALMSVYCFIRAIFSKEKGAFAAALCLAVSVGILVYFSRYSEVSAKQGFYYYLTFAYNALRGEEAVLDLMKAFVYLVSFCFVFNVIVEASRIATGKHCNGAGVFRYVVLAALAIAAWVVPVIVNGTEIFSFIPSIVAAGAAVVMLIVNIIGSVRERKKSEKAKKEKKNKKPKKIIIGYLY